MGEQTLFEKLGVKYEERDGILYPLITTDVEDKNIDVGKYGRMWMKYMQEEYPVRYKSLVRFCELYSKAVQVNELAYELLDDIENEWLSSHRAKNKNSFVEMFRLRTQARLIAEEMVLYEVVYMFH